MTIDIDFDVLDTVSSRSKDLATDVRNSATRIDSIADSVVLSWKSSASSSYTYEVEETATRLRRIASDLEKLSNALTKYTSQMRKLEKELADKVGK